MEGERDFAQLYDETRKPLWAYVYRSSGSADGADDIVQEAFLRFWRTDIHDIDHDQARRYLFTIASNLLRDRWRASARQQSWRARWLRDQTDAQSADTGLPEEQGSHEDPGATFQRLKPRARALLWMAYVEETDHADTGEALGLTRGSVKVMLFRARERLRALIAETNKKAGDARTHSRN